MVVPPLADQVPQLGGQGRRHPGHGGGQGPAKIPPLVPIAAGPLAAAGVEHGSAPPRQHGASLLPPGPFQGGEPLVRLGLPQGPPHLGDGHLHGLAAVPRQETLQLGVGQGHVGAHHHQPAPGGA